MIRLLLDQGLAPAAAAMLGAAGLDAVHVAELGMARSHDADILEYAAANGRVCVTLDHDFHRHLATARAHGPSVLFLRVQGMNAQEQADFVKAVVLRCADELSAGAAVSAGRDSLRVRRLPLS